MIHLANTWRKNIYYHAPWPLAMILIFISSSLSSDDLPDLALKFSDKFIHFMIYGILAVLVFRSFSQMQNRFIRENEAKLSIMLTFLYGGLDEIHQYFVPGRSMSFYDWIADLLGAVILLFIYRKFFYGRRFFQNTGKRANTGR